MVEPTAIPPSGKFSHFYDLVTLGQMGSGTFRQTVTIGPEEGLAYVLFDLIISCESESVQVGILDNESFNRHDYIPDNVTVKTGSEMIRGMRPVILYGRPLKIVLENLTIFEQRVGVFAPVVIVPEGDAQRVRTIRGTSWRREASHG